MSRSLTARLLDSTADDHGAVESTPFMVALQKRTLPPHKPYALLQGLHAMAGALERCIRSSDDATLQRLWDEDLAKYDLLSTDLVTIGSRVPKAAQANPHINITVAVAEYAQRVHDAASKHPLALIGYLFTQESNMLEAPVLKSHVGSIVGTSPATLRYYNAYPDPIAQWNRFRQRLEAEVVTTSQQDMVEYGARDAFRLLRRLYDALSADAHRWPGMTGKAIGYRVTEMMGAGVVSARLKRETSTTTQAFKPR